MVIVDINVHLWYYRGKRSVVLKISSRLCRHFSPQCDSHGRSNQLTQSSAMDSPGSFLIFHFVTCPMVCLENHHLIITRINDLSKEAILQCINEGDLRFLAVIWSTKFIHEYFIFIIHIADSDFGFLIDVDFQLLFTNPQNLFHEYLIFKFILATVTLDFLFIWIFSFWSPI